MQKLKQQQLLDRMLEKLPDHVTFLLVILSGFLLARLTWTLFPADPSLLTAVNQAEIAPVVEVIPASATDIGQELANYHLLGVYQAPQAPVVAVLEQAPPAPTPEAPRTPLKLVGVYALPNKNGVAVIDVNGTQKVIGIGEAIEGSNGATLEKVFADKIELSWQGKIETLGMPKLSEGVSAGAGAEPAPVEEYIPEAEPEMVPDQLMLQQQQLDQQKIQQEESEEEGGAPQAPGQVPVPPGAAPPQAPGIDPEANAGGDAGLGNFRQQVAQNNLKLLEVVRPSPVSEKGQLTGFRVTPGQNEALFRQTGLQAGDIVTGINGTPLNSNSSSLQAMQGLMTSASAELTILRAGQTTSVRVSF